MNVENVLKKWGKILDSVAPDMSEQDKLEIAKITDVSSEIMFQNQIANEKPYLSSGGAGMGPIEPNDKHITVGPMQMSVLPLIVSSLIKVQTNTSNIFYVDIDSDVVTELLEIKFSHHYEIEDLQLRDNMVSAQIRDSIRKNIESKFMICNKLFINSIFPIGKDFINEKDEILKLLFKWKPIKTFTVDTTIIIEEIDNSDFHQPIVGGITHEE